MPTIQLSPRFKKAMAKLNAAKRAEAKDALNQFVSTPDLPGLNFEKLAGTKTAYTIRTNGGDRICLRKTAKGKYDVADIGSHDKIYRTWG